MDPNNKPTEDAEELPMKTSEEDIVITPPSKPVSIEEKKEEPVNKNTETISSENVGKDHSVTKDMDYFEMVLYIIIVIDCLMVYALMHKAFFKSSE
jgi:hypothetical protein